MRYKARQAGPVLRVVIWQPASEPLSLHAPSRPVMSTRHWTHAEKFLLECGMYNITDLANMYLKWIPLMPGMVIQIIRVPRQIMRADCLWINNIKLHLTFGFYETSFKRCAFLSFLVFVPSFGYNIIDAREFYGYSDWLRAGRLRDRSSSPGRVKNFLFSKSSRPALGSTQPLIQWVPGGSFPGGKAAGAWSWPLTSN
jgi:hypothetical protein